MTILPLQLGNLRLRQGNCAMRNRARISTWCVSFQTFFFFLTSWLPTQALWEALKTLILRPLSYTKGMEVELNICGLQKLHEVSKLMLSKWWNHYPNYAPLPTLPSTAHTPKPGFFTNRRISNTGHSIVIRFVFIIYERSTMGWILYVFSGSHGNHLGMKYCQFTWFTELT